MCKGCTFLADGRLMRQVDGCPMGSLIWKLYKSYVDDIYSKQIKNQTDDLFEKLNNYHPNIKFTIEVNPSKFLDTEIMIKNGIIETSTVIKESKNPMTGHQQSSIREI